ncbi:rRNA pseudouridine synthase [Candidatus Saccharibacteria bacterium]|nr:rRNA pseudouridine synthase [Candidatus Saccharibacteria bacterium]
MAQPQPSSNRPADTIRLNKFLAERLGISRREADEVIAAGKVTIDGTTAALGARLATPVNLDNSPKVCYNGSIVPFQTDFLYLALNKPVGYVCSRRAQGDAPTIYELLPAKYRQLKTVGRLDKDSSGLILLTNDGDFAYQMTHPKFHKEKIYQVTLDHPLEPLHQQMISDYGISLEDGVSRFTVIRDTSYNSAEPATHYTVILSEGRNRQIRRTFAALGYHVVALHRTQFGKYELTGLNTGEYTEIPR